MDVNAQKKVCPVCGLAMPAGHNYCPDDGAELQYGPAGLLCPECGREYGARLRHCPADGHQLADISADPAPGQGKAEPGPGEGAAARQGAILEELDGEARESFLRGLCPRCGAWKNWRQAGDEYWCQTCSEIFTYRDGQLYAGGSPSAIEARAERLESSPYAAVLGAIDEANREYWTRQFEQFDRNPKHSQWNWPSFFFDVYRYLWKGMWKKGLAIVGILLAAGFAVSILDLLPGRTAGYGGGFENSASPLLVFVASLGIKAYLGSVGSRDYYRFVKGFEGDAAGARRNLVISRLFLGLAVALSVALKIL